MKLLILSGGGARGAFQAGVYDSLRKDGYKPDAVAGISVGALNGSMIATGQGGKMKNLWWNITPNQVLKKNNLIQAGKTFLFRKFGSRFFKPEKLALGYYSNDPLRKLLRSNIGSMFVCDFYCGTVSLNNLKYHSHLMRRMMVPWSFIDEILASTAIPLVFNPVNINNELHVDGGVRHMSPIKQILQDKDPTEIRIVLCNKFKGYRALDKGPVTDPIDLAKRTLDTLLNEIFMKDLKEFERINRLVKQAADHNIELEKSNGKAYKNYRTFIYEPNESLGDSLNFKSDQAIRNYKHGMEVKPIEI